MSETRIVGDVLQFLNGLPHTHAWRNNTGAVRAGARMVRFSEPGAADVLAVRSGQFLAVECKVPGKKQSPAQHAWQATIESCGGLYYCVTSVQELAARLEVACW